MAQRLTDLEEGDRSWIDTAVDRCVAGGPRGPTPSDAELQAVVTRRLAQDRLLDAHALIVTVEDGTVRLEGKVRSLSDCNLAVMLAHEVSGPAEVRVELIVDPGLPGEAPGFRVREPPELHPEDDPLPRFIA